MTDPRGRHVPASQLPAGPKDPESMHHDGSFKKYMQFKNQKLREQFRDKARDATSNGKLFAGITIHVNGLTNPTHQELKQIMAEHGGTFELYYSRHRVTHIICSNLPTAKVKALQKERASTPVVRPEWIVDSMKEGRLLPHEDYLLWRLRDKPGQSTLALFPPQAVGRSAAAAGSAPEADILHQPAARPLRPKSASAQAEAPCAAAAGCPDYLPGSSSLHGAARRAEAGTSNADAADEDHPGESSAAAVQGRKRDRAAFNGREGSLGIRSPVPESPVSGGLHDLDSPAKKLQRAQQVAAGCRAACDMLKGAPKSSREDPHFMDNYYKASRLHFIGTWKARIEALAAKSAGAGLPQPSVLAAGRPKERCIMHLDMDCFFCSVAALTDRSLQGLPLVVCHSNSTNGTGEISSANYEARAHGIRAMMGIGEAKRLCPGLVVMPYQYEKYQAISEQVYGILLQCTRAVQPVSCDEAFLDVTGQGDPEALAAQLRAAIFQSTGCTASAGIAHNILLAKLATNCAKPNGQFRLPADQVDRHLLPLAVDALPGVGWSTRRRLRAMGIHTVADLREKSSQQALQREFGSKSGALLWAAAHGRDDRPVEPMKPRRSIGAEVNWGIRFESEAAAHDFLLGLAGEVQNRMREARVRGRCISLKVKKRRSNAPEPPKFLGHGSCDNLSRSVTLSHATDAAPTLASEAAALLRALRVPADQIRGIGISVSKLDNDTSAATGSGRSGPLAATSALPFRPANGQQPAGPKHAGSPQERCEAPTEGTAPSAGREKADARQNAQASPDAPESSHSLPEQEAEAERTVSGGSEFRGPASPGCVYSGLQLELGDADDTPDSQACSHEAAPAAQPISMQQAAPGPQAAGTPIVALPPASQIDPAVLDALPLPLKREFERAYGIGGMRNPAARAKRKRGGKQVALGRPIQRHLTEAVAPRDGRRSGWDPASVDLDVLAELPLDVQQEVAAAMSRARQLSTARPRPPVSPSQPMPPPPPMETYCPAREQPRELWPTLELALRQISDALDPHYGESEESRDGLMSIAESQLEELGGVVLEIGCGCVRDDLEGLQFLLRRLHTTAGMFPNLRDTLCRWSKDLQTHVGRQWHGKQLMLAS